MCIKQYLIMSNMQVVKVEGTYVSLTDMANEYAGASVLIEEWIRTRETIEFISLWEEENNPNFIPISTRKNKVGDRFDKAPTSIKEWIGATNSIGIIATAGRYGGIYATPEIAIQFAMHLNVYYRASVIREINEKKEILSILGEFLKYKKEQIDEDCYLYLMLNKNNGHYKIGISKSPSYRERTLQSQEPVLDLIFSKLYKQRSRAVSVEKILHSTFSEKRIRGEWFLLNEDDIKKIYSIVRQLRKIKKG